MDRFQNCKSLVLFYTFVICISRLGGMDTKGPMRINVTGSDDSSMSSGQLGQSRF